MRAWGVAIGAVLLTTGCAASVMSFPEGCANGRCTLSGRLTVHYASKHHAGGELRLADGRCMRVLLPSAVLVAQSEWTDRQVTIRGRELPAVPEGANISAIAYEDRWLAAGLCDSATVLYADRVERSAG